MQSVPVPVAGRPLSGLRSPAASTAAVRASAAMALASSSASSVRPTDTRQSRLIVPTGARAGAVGSPTASRLPSPTVARHSATTPSRSMRSIS